jgi:hypothetical protein
MAIDTSVHTESIVSINQSKLNVKKFAEFLPLFAMAMKKRPTSAKKLW